MAPVPAEINDDFRRQYLWTLEFKDGTRTTDYKYSRIYDQFINDDNATKIYAKTKDLYAKYYLFAFK